MEQIKSYRMSDTGRTDNLVNFQNKTPCADRVSVDFINNATCGGKPEVRRPKIFNHHHKRFILYRVNHTVLHCNSKIRNTLMLLEEKFGFLQLL